MRRCKDHTYDDPLHLHYDPQDRVPLSTQLRIVGYTLTDKDYFTVAP
jgi:hypothetical protein